jgi:hypothetical protein
MSDYNAPIKLGKRAKAHQQALDKLDRLRAISRERILAKNQQKSLAGVKTIDDLVQSNLVIGVVASSQYKRPYEASQAYIPKFSDHRPTVNSSSEILEGTPAELFKTYFKTDDQQAKIFMYLLGRKPEPVKKAYA